MPPGLICNKKTMNNLSPQYPKVQAWSQIRARVRSAWNDLFYTDGPPDDDPVPNTLSSITLRKLFAIIWLIAALTATWRYDMASVVLVGVPIGLLGYCLLANGKIRPVRGILFVGWGIVGYYCCFILPYTKTRIKSFPPTATKLYSESDWFCERIRFSASVDDCKVAAERLVAEDRRYFSNVLPNPRPINKKQGQFPALRKRTNYEQRPSWFDPQNIEVGWQYEFTFTQIWIDSERGLFYYEFLD